MPTSRLEIDLSSIERNLGVLRGVLGGDEPARATGARAASGGRPHRVGVCAVVKQDGYGAGAARIAKRLGAAGVDMFSVYSLDEARALADAVSTVPVLVLMPVHGVDRHDPLYRHAASGRVHLTLHSPEQLRAVSETAARIGTPMPVHVQVDTGLTRGGCVPEVAAALVDKVLSSPKMRLAGLMTHFSSPCCDEAATREQARAFRELVEMVKPTIKAAVSAGKGAGVMPDIALHAANSCAAFRSRALHGSMVRCGQSLLGYLTDGDDPPADFEFAAQARTLEPAVRWTSSIVHVQEVPAGWGVGYGSTWRAPYRADGRKTRIAIVPVGYADGYPRALGNAGVVGLTGQAWERRGAAEPDVSTPAMGQDASHIVYAPVVGRVSMDQITVDVTDVPEAYLRGAAQASSAGGEHAGPEVEIYSRRRGAANFIGVLAEKAGSITHELLCRIGPRVERVYRSPAMTGESGVATSPVRSLAVTGATGGTGGIGGAAAVAR